MKKIEQAFRKIILSELLFSIIYAVVGLIIVLNSEMTNKVVGILIGTFFLLAGVLNIFTFIEKSKIKLFHYNAIFGILDIILSIFIMFNPLSIINFLGITLGIWLIVKSANKIVYFLYLKQSKEKGNKIIFASAILFLILGIMLLVNPFRNLIITQVVGMFVILYNVLNINDLVLLKKKSNEYLKLFK